MEQSWLSRIARYVLICLVLSPLVLYGSFIIKFGIGLTSSFALTRYAGLVFVMGLVIGIIASVYATITKGRTSSTVSMTGVTVFAIMGVFTVPALFSGRITRSDALGAVCDLVITSLAAAMVARVAVSVTGLAGRVVDP